MSYRMKAPSLGIAAGKKPQAVVDITAVVQERLRGVINELGVGGGGAPGGPVLGQSQPTLIELEKNISDVHSQLCRQNFALEDIENALQALSPDTITEEAALDWLLFNLDRSQLPQHYADQVQITAPVELRHKAKETVQHPIENEEKEDERLKKEDEEREAVRRATEAEEAHAAREKNKQETEERERVARRAWILRYAEGGSSSEEEDSDDAGGGVIEDWEVWADPQEVIHRKAERQRAALPIEDRLLLIAEELASAKDRAAVAKSSGDKATQRSIGQVIGQLKREMVALGVQEEDLPRGIAREGDLQRGDETQNNGDNAVEDGDGETTVHSDDVAECLNDDRCLGTGGEGGGTNVACGERGMMDFDFDLFGDGSDVNELEYTDPTKSKRARALAKARAAVQPWGADHQVGRSGRVKAKGKDSHVTKAPEMQLPRALLHQACQKRGWGAPRYERLSPGGARDPNSAGCRYGIQIDIGSTNRSNGKFFYQQKKAAGQKAAAGPQSDLGLLQFVLPEADDGWPRIEQAQNAAATFALLSLCGDEDPDVWQRLPEPYNELWLTWQAAGTAAPVEETEDDIASRSEFSKSLAKKKLAAFALQTESEEDHALGSSAPAGMFHDGLPSWEDTLNHSLQKHLAAMKNEDVSRRAVSERMLRVQQQWRLSAQGIHWMSARGKLPVAALRERLLEALAIHDVVVVSGETGSGKTTQVPQFILEGATEGGHGGHTSVVCTQPRRIAAISVADRVAHERGEPGPGQRGGIVGYTVRLDSATNSDTRLLFCTTGVLLRRLTSDPALVSVSHVVVDEVHERTMQGDFLMALLKELIVRRRDAGLPLKVVLMSATLDASQMAEYFGGCPILHAQGRTFPVQQYYLEDVYEMTEYVLSPDAPASLKPNAAWRHRHRKLEGTAGAKNRAVVRSGWGDEEADGPPLNPFYDEERYQDLSLCARRNLARLDEEKIDLDLLEDLVHYVHDSQGDGAILVFLPGMAEIGALQRRLESVRALRGHWVLQLHSTVAPADQRKAFKLPPKGIRKIVLATNIAETSVTVEDVRFVIDTGRHKERRYDPARSMSLLVEDWTSAASVKQRRGRAGRTQEGVFYALYTRHRFESQMKKFGTPEMLRVPLEELVLQIHLLRLGRHAQEFTSKVLQPPPFKAVQGAIRTLCDVGALAEDESLTPLGYHLAQLPVDTRVGKLLLLGAWLGCLSPALSIAACLSHKSPFAGGSLQDDSDRARTALAATDSGTLASGQQSDHLVMAAAMHGWLSAAHQGGFKSAAEFARKHSLSVQTLDMLRDMRAQFANMVEDIGFSAPGGRGGSRTPNFGTPHDQQRRGSGAVAWFDDPTHPVNQHASHPAVVKAVLFAALQPNVAVMEQGPFPTGRPGWHDGMGTVAIHPSSVCASLTSSGYKSFQRPFITYLEKVRTSQVFLRDCTVVSPAAVLLFGGGDLRVDHGAGRATVSGWIQLKVPGKTAALVRRLRWGLQELLAKRVAAPKTGRQIRGEMGDGEAEIIIIKAIVELLNHEEAAQSWGS